MLAKDYFSYQADKPLQTVAVTALSLTHFRNYERYQLACDERPVVITGKNGIGKTNILEALSLLAPGKGLRGATLPSMDYRGESTYKSPWGIRFTLASGDYSTEIGTAHDGKGKRRIKIDQEEKRHQTALLEQCSVIWLTPAMAGLFTGPASERRKYLDRIICYFDSEHSSRLYAYEHSMRERMVLLKEQGDPKWIQILEAKMAERSVAIAAARLEILERLTHHIVHDQEARFPKAELHINGAVEQQLQKNIPAVEIEENILAELHRYRQEDANYGRTRFGIHRSDLNVTYQTTSMMAAECSTGEQKALLLSMIMAEARAKALWSGKTPILLFDEVIAHLDEARREALFEESLALKMQIWMTGVERGVFSFLEDKARFI